ncbi:GNAT family N-acetyltransferase [Sedimenticola sp.]|uniref:GNAT family N-acetyltransferase n=1 Tax=Sedimenticola sp. TaxID=1940285 RepID=UPI003D0B97AA
MRKQVYRLAKNYKKLLFEAVENIEHPVNRKSIRDELKQSEFIGSTQGGMEIYLFDYRSNSSVIREIGRLRELLFRQLHEGTGKSIDEFDRYYRHQVLWDDKQLGIIGTYRIGEGMRILAQHGIQGFYTNTLFELQGDMVSDLEKSIELGRSFIQPRCWGKRSLDYLWYGISAYLQRHPQVKYMIGPVILSATYPEAARHEIVNFYQQLFCNNQSLVKPRLPYDYPVTREYAEFQLVNQESEYKLAYSRLKQKLDLLRVRVQTLFKQYVELCELGGCELLELNVDPEFSNCIDAMILVHIDAVYEKNPDRYINVHNARVEQAA